ncbi:MAG: hypothetical protein OXH47_07360 [Paracoccaceae bacterium]|nr:hypothetical protein [Paracoccaceae bacterium]
MVLAIKGEITLFGWVVKSCDRLTYNIAREQPRELAPVICKGLKRKVGFTQWHFLKESSFSSPESQALQKTDQHAYFSFLLFLMGFIDFLGTSGWVAIGYECEVFPQPSASPSRQPFRHGSTTIPRG